MHHRVLPVQIQIHWEGARDGHTQVKTDCINVLFQASLWLSWWWYNLCETTGTMTWRRRWHWRTPREPWCCSSGSSSCSCKTWMPSPTTCASPWSSTITTTVRLCQTNYFGIYSKIVNTSPLALLPKSPLMTTNHQASERANVTASGLKAWRCTSRWARCRRRSTPWECACQRNKAGWRSSKNGTKGLRPSRFLRVTLHRGNWSRWVQKEDY